MTEHSSKPLIHCITNPISITGCANLILALSCRPIMAEHPDEVREITRTSSALLLNIGNITDSRMKSIKLSFAEAQTSNIPTVFDAVGVSCSSLRRNFTKELLNLFTPTVLKGNYSEIKTLCNETYTSSGVDSDPAVTEDEIRTLAPKLAKQLGCIILASGKTDIVTDGKKLILIENGCASLGKITGSGCMLGATCACTVASDTGIDSVAYACALFGICGENAEKAQGLGSFTTALLDNLSVITPAVIEKHIRKKEYCIEKT